MPSASSAIKVMHGCCRELAGKVEWLAGLLWQVVRVYRLIDDGLVTRNSDKPLCDCLTVAARDFQNAEWVFTAGVRGE